MVTENFHSNRILSGIFSRLIGRALLGQWALQRAGWLAPFASVPQLRVLRWMPGQNSAERRKFGTQSRRGKERKDRRRWEWNVDRDWNQRERGEERKKVGRRNRRMGEGEETRWKLKRRQIVCVRKKWKSGKVEKWEEGMCTCGGLLASQHQWSSHTPDSLWLPLTTVYSSCTRVQSAIDTHFDHAHRLKQTSNCWRFIRWFFIKRPQPCGKWWWKLAVATCSNVYFDCFRMRLICNAWIVDTFT